MSFKKFMISAACISAGFSFTAPVQASSNPYLGEIMPTGYNFCPRGWAPTEGQLFSIAQNTALFSLLGTTYGGDGRTTFGIPDLRGRTPIGQGRGPGLADYRLGERGGITVFTLTEAQMAPHTHQGQLRADADSTADSNVPQRNSVGRTRALNMYSTVDPDANMNAGDARILPTGGGEAVSKRSPFQTAKFCIAILGTYPSRP